MRKSSVFGVSALLIWLLLPAVLIAQVIKPDSTTHWKRKVVSNFNVNQASFSSNWKAGGINSIGLNGAFNYKANYAKGKSSWDNEVDFLYGFVNNSGQGFRKTLDRVFLDSKYGHRLSDKWDLFTSMNFLSQFAAGYKYDADNTASLISDFMAPAFITSAWGVEYSPVDYFKMRISPFAPRLTIVRNNNGRFDAVDTEHPYGVLVGESLRYEWFAFQFTADFDKNIAENLNLKWRYMLFANYETLAAKTIDHRLDLMITARVNKYISVSLGGIMLYDYDQDTAMQLSQVFNFGFRYSFQNFAE